MVSKISMQVIYDPFILRMAHHSIAMPEFKKQYADMMKEQKAFVYKMKGSLTVTVHPSDALLDAFYCAMGLK